MCNHEFMRITTYGLVQIKWCKSCGTLDANGEIYIPHHLNESDNPAMNASPVTGRGISEDTKEE